MKFFLFVLTALLFSCARNNEAANENAGLVCYLTWQESGEKSVLSADYQDELDFFENLKVGFDIHLENIDNSEALIKKLIYDDKNFEEYTEYRKNDFIGNLDEELYTVIHDSGSLYYNDLNVRFNIMYHCNLYAVIKHYEYFYTGGAHGNYWTRYYIIDLTEERILALEDLTDQIPDGILKQLIAEAYNITRFLSDDFWPPDSIYIAGGGVNIIWNTYSITPYSDGLIDIEIPDLIIQQYLTDKGKHIKTLTGGMN